MSWEERVIYKVKTVTTNPPLEFSVHTTGIPRDFAIFMYPINTTSVRTYVARFTIPEEIACGFMNGVDNMVDYQVEQALFDLHKQSGWSF